MKKIMAMLLVILFLSSSCGNKYNKIDCNFTDEIILYITDKYSSILSEISFNNDSQVILDFKEKEYDFDQYYFEIIYTDKKFDANIFMDKYNLLMNSIPDDINKMVGASFEPYSISAIDFYNFFVILYLTYYELVYMNKDDEYKKSVGKPWEKINIENINKAKKLFNNNDIKIFEKNKIYIINKIFKEEYS